MLERGPILENVVAGRDVDLTRFPAPLWHEHDGGRYIGTGVAVVTSDPDTGRINVGAYRMMIQEDGRSATINAEAGKQGRAQYDRWFAKHGKAPVLASFGHDPLLLMVAGTEVPNTISEYAYAGAMVGEKLERRPRRGDRPADAGRRPRSSWRAGSVQTGCFAKGRSASGPATIRVPGVPVPTIDIERLYFRNDPIILGAPPGKPPNDYSYMRALLKSAMIQDELSKVGVRDVRGVWAHETGGGRLLIVVSITQRFCGHSRQAGYIAAQCQAAAYMNRFVIVVDDDVDPMNLEEVMWAVCTRCEPAGGHRDHAQVVGQQGGPAAREPGGSVQHARAHRCLPPVREARHVPTRGAGEPGAASVRRSPSGRISSPTRASRCRRASSRRRR